MFSSTFFVENVGSQIEATNGSKYNAFIYFPQARGLAAKQCIIKLHNNKVLQLLYFRCDFAGIINS
jgi:hypothetical protein